ncbi:hypothetical protein ABPG72_010190 [Tetrahymena utriculariae]
MEVEQQIDNSQVKDKKILLFLQFLEKQYSTRQVIMLQSFNELFVQLQEEFRNLYESHGRSVTEAIGFSTLQEYKVFLKCIDELFTLIEVEDTNQLYFHLNSDEIIEWILARHKENNLDKSLPFMAPVDNIQQLPSHIQGVCFVIFEDDKLKKSYAVFQSEEQLIENIIHQKIGELLQIEIDLQVIYKKSNQKFYFLQRQKNIQTITDESIKFLNEKCQGYFKLVGYFQKSKKYIFKFESDFSNKESIKKLTQDIVNEVFSKQDKSESNYQLFE